MRIALWISEVDNSKQEVEVTSIENVKSTIENYCREKKVNKCSFAITGEAEVIEREVAEMYCLFG